MQSMSQGSQMSQSSQQFTEQSQQQAVRQLQEATQRLQQSQNPSERAQWAQQVRQHADQIASFSGSGSRQPQKTAISIEATVPSPEAFQQLAQQLSQSTPGLKEVSYRREGGTPKVRIQATHEALPQIEQVLQQVARTVTQAYSGSSS